MDGCIVRYAAIQFSDACKSLPSQQALDGSFSWVFCVCPYHNCTIAAGFVNSRRSAVLVTQCIMYEQHKRFFSEYSQILYYSSKSLHCVDIPQQFLVSF